MGVTKGDEIPVRKIEPGESRPTWWLSCWHDHIVVVEGTINFNENEEPDVKVIVNDKVADQLFEPLVRNLQKAHSSFRFAKLKPNRLLYASSGIEFENTAIGKIPAGGKKEIIFLLPILEVNNAKMALRGVKNNMKGIYIFTYDSRIVPGVSLMFKEPIPPDGVKSATGIFNHRLNRDHTK